MSQGSTVLPTTGVFSGLTEQGNINAALAALVSENSGGSPPSSPAPVVGQPWLDTSVSGYVTHRRYNGSTWNPIWTLDLTTGLISLAASEPQNWTVASGTHDAITAAYDPPVTGPLADGTVLAFRATSANLTTAPTFSPNGLGAGVITKNGGQALAPGDIPGNLAEVQLRWNLAQTRFELLNPPAVPVGGIVPYFGGTLPSGFALPQGQNLSATTFPAANAVLGTTYGNPGGGNFTMPDLRGRFFFNLDAGGTTRMSSIGATLGATGGSQSYTIAQNQLPNVTPTFAGTAATITSNQSNIANYDDDQSYAPAGEGNVGTVSFPVGVNPPVGPVTASYTPAGNVSSINGNVTQQALTTIPPAMGINCMMRIV